MNCDEKRKIMRTMALVSGVVFTSVITIPTVVSATNNSGDTLVEYIDMVLPAYLNGEISESSEITISNIFNLFNNDNRAGYEPNICLELTFITVILSIISTIQIHRQRIM